MSSNTIKITDVNPERLKKLLRSLVDIYSPSGKEEEILEYAEKYLKKAGLLVTRQEVDENRYNLIVFPEGRETVDVCYVGHMDTVAAYDLEDFGFSDEGDAISGLGTADMKAGCAAMIEAFTVLAERSSPFPAVGLVLLVDEEEDNKGAKSFIEGEYTAPWAIIGEPTNMTPCLGHYGYLEVMLRTQGKRAHSAMPELGQNAIEAMLKLLLLVTEYAISSPHGLVYNVRELSGFPGGFVVPDACEAWLDLHLPPNSRIDILKTELEQLISEADREIPHLDASLKFEDTYSGYLISENRPLVGKLKEAYRKLSLPWEPQEFRSHSDGNILWAAGIDPVILGPGRLEAAHTPEESVSFEQVVLAAQLYLNLALSLA
ncbi:MAG TPA: M20 family metallopeptidase [Dehalococcoidia bacterium]|nr:M20 family metallopeptidase [Dehalococcoidia bacterium]